MLAVDCSNYSDPLTSDALERLKAAGIQHAIVQAVDPPPGYPPGQTREQIRACLGAGLTVDAYVWLWFDLDVHDIKAKLMLLEGLEVRQLWLDVEDTAAIKYDQATCEAKVQAALDACDLYPATNGQRCGIYTGRWYWAAQRYMGDTTGFSDRELWDANYDQVADASVGFVPYGGWTLERLRIKQYHGTTSLGGVGGLDLNVLSVNEEQELVESGPTPEPCAPLKAAIERAVNRLQLEMAKPRLSRKLVGEIQRELFGALQS